MSVKRRGYECSGVSVVERWERIVIAVQGHGGLGDGHVIENVSALQSFVVDIAVEEGRGCGEAGAVTLLAGGRGGVCGREGPGGHLL